MSLVASSEEALAGLPVAVQVAGLRMAGKPIPAALAEAAAAEEAAAAAKRAAAAAAARNAPANAHYKKRKSTKHNPGPKVTIGRIEDSLYPEDEEYEEEYEPTTSVATSAASASMRVVEAGAPLMTLPAYKKAVVSILKEFFVAKDFDECMVCLQELDTPYYNYEFVRRALIMAVERTEADRELISRLLSSMYSVSLLMEDIAKGFERFFESIDDLELDAPGAAKFAAKFLARAVVDEILPPAFLNDPVISSLAGPILDNAKAMLNVKHSAERIEHVWAAASLAPSVDLKAMIKDTMLEFFTTGDATEAARCLKEMGVPYFMHEAVYRAIVLAIDTWPAAERADATAAVLKHLNAAGVVSDYQVYLGCRRVRDAMPDLQLDTPGARTAFEHILRALTANGTLKEALKADESTATASATSA